MRHQFETLNSIRTLESRVISFAIEATSKRKNVNQPNGSRNIESFRETLNIIAEIIRYFASEKNSEYIYLSSKTEIILNNNLIWKILIFLKIGRPHLALHFWNTERRRECEGASAFTIS